MRNWFRGTSAAGDDVVELRNWVEQLAQENMRLRLSQQRPSSPGQYADDLRELSATLSTHASGAGADAEDEALHALAEAATIRRSVVDVLVRLQVVAAQLERQLSAELPHAEIDRRVLADRNDHPGLRSSDRGFPTSGQPQDSGIRGSSDTPSAAVTAEVLAEMERTLDSNVSSGELSQATGRAVA